MKRKLMALVMGLGMVVGVGASIQSAVAADPAPTLDQRVQALEDKAKSGIDISGSLDVYYSLNFQNPTGTGVTGTFNGPEQAGRNFDLRADEFSLSLFDLIIQKAPSPVGFRVDLDYGPTTDWVHAFEPGGTEVFKHVQQAYLTYVAPVGKGLTIDFGKFVTHMGFEVIESKDNWNYSRSYLFSWAIPYYHAGLRISYPVVDGVTVTLLGVNGWNNVQENNDGKTVGAQVAVTLIPKVTFIQNGIWGGEGVGVNGLRRDVYDTVLIVTPTDKLSLGTNFDYGNDDTSGVSGVGKSAWFGVAGYGRYAFTDKTALALRGEWYKDPDGFTTGTVQTLGEFTATGEWKIGNNLLTRLEYRRDWSNQNTFNSTTGPASANQQDTITLGAVYTF